MEKEIQNYVDAMNEKVREESKKYNYESYLSDHLVKFVPGGRNYGRIDTGTRVHSFIALKDISTKSLTFKKGDILKPASYKAPAKHARGSVYDPKSYEGYSTNGPHYL